MILVLPFMLALSGTSIAQSDLPWSSDATSPTIERLERQIAAGDTAAAGRFWQQLATSHTPIIEPIPGDAGCRLVTFAYRGSPDTHAVVLLSQMISSQDPSGNALAHIERTDVWFKKLGRSILQLSEAPPQPFVTPRSDVVRGTLDELSNHLAKLGRAENPNVSTIIESRHPGAMYVVIHHLVPNDPIEAVLELPGQPQASTIYDRAGTAPEGARRMRTAWRHRDM
jgi:hypothetical protein